MLVDRFAVGSSVFGRGSLHLVLYLDHIDGILGYRAVADYDRHVPHNLQFIDAVEHRLIFVARKIGFRQDYHSIDVGVFGKELHQNSDIGHTRRVANQNVLLAAPQRLQTLDRGSHIAPNQRGMLVDGYYTDLKVTHC